MRSFALYSIKGGVGKTSTVVNLARLAASEGARTLLWDLDPQGAATYMFRIKPKIKGGARGLFRRKRPIEKHIKGTDYENLDLLPADFSYRNLDLVLAKTKKAPSRIRKVLRPLRREYDYLFMDCPPGLNLASEAVFNASDVLLIPIVPTPLSSRTLDQFLDFLAKEKIKAPRILPFFSMVDRRKALHRRLTESLPRQRPEFLTSSIPFASEVEKMAVHRQPLDRGRKGRAAAAFASLWREIQERTR